MSYHTKLLLLAFQLAKSTGVTSMFRLTQDLNRGLSHVAPVLHSAALPPVPMWLGHAWSALTLPSYNMPTWQEIQLQIRLKTHEKREALPIGNRHIFIMFAKNLCNSLINRSNKQHRPPLPPMERSKFKSNNLTVSISRQFCGFPQG